jgi:hypothetical protein
MGKKFYVDVLQSGQEFFKFNLAKLSTHVWHLTAVMGQINVLHVTNVHY